MGRTMRHVGIGLFAITAAAAAASAAGGDDQRLADHFGFQPLEIYKHDSRIHSLIVRDFDGDKVDDIAVVNNARSRIDLLLTTPGKAETPARSEPNQVKNDRRMRLKTIPVNQEIVSLQAGDFNGDGKIDLAYYGAPAALFILFNHGGANFDSTRRISSGEAVEASSALAVGDLNRDGRADLALLAANEVLTVLQLENGKLGEPERMPHAATNPRIMKAVDLDGDGGDDLVIIDSAADEPFRVRFATADGQLGPEQRFALEPLRAYAFSDVDGKPGSEVLTIERQSGRVKAHKLGEGGDDEADKWGRLLVYPLPRGDARGRSIAVGDLDGDHKADVVVTDPANAHCYVYLQGKEGLNAYRTFPGLLGGKSARVADLDGDGKGEVIVLSEQEKQIARARWSDGRLNFPAALPIVGEPVALDVADVDGDQIAEVVYVTRKGGDSGAGETFQLRALKRAEGDRFAPVRWGDAEEVAIAGITGNSAAVKVVDANNDGHPDVLIFHSSRSPILLLGKAGGAAPEALKGSMGPLVGVEAAGVSARTPGGEGILVAQNTFARRVSLNAAGQWDVRDQYNSGRSAAQIIGAAAFDVDGDGTREVALVDRASKSVLFLKERDGVYRPGGSMTLGAIDFQGAQVADFNGDGKDDVLLAGADKFGIVSTSRNRLSFKTIASYEPARQEAVLGDLIAGDLNGDGHLDLAIADIAEHLIEIVTFTKPDKLERAVSFKVFEQKSFRDRDHLVEPRELGVGDVDGDGRTDLVLIVHDRVLIYRQDPGPVKAEKTAGK